MYALHLPSRHLLVAGLALALALVFVLATGVFSALDLNLITGAAGTDPAPVPPATWASDPLAPPTLLLTR